MLRCKEDKLFTLCHPELVSGSRNSQAERTPLTRIYKFASSLINSTLSRKGQGEKAAFTLAEVLITLGIIGVVAAITLPTLIQNFQKKETVSKLKHFRSLLAQAAEMRNKDTILGNFKPLESLTPHSPDAMLEFYNIYWKPYIKTSGYQKREKGLNVEFSNGTSAYLIKNPCPDDVVTGCLYVVYCTKHKYCKNIVENALIQNIVDTQNKFIFWTNGKTPTDFKGTRDELIEKCKTSHYYCSHLIEIDGWQISEDYPW